MQKHLLNSKTLALGLTTIMFLSLMTVTVPAQASTVWHVYDGQLIQDVVDAASPGDTIIVHAGTYKQTMITKSLTLIGDNATIIPEPPNGGTIGFNVGEVDGVKISGFTIIAPDTAILLYGVSNSEITGNKAKGGNYGILLAGASNNNDITDNEAEGGWNGISLQDGASNNEITRNKVKGMVGICLYPNWDMWMYLMGHAFGDPSNNEIDENKIENCMYGIYLESSQHNEIRGNKVENCSMFGILLQEASNKEITNNKVKNCMIGIYLDSSQYNKICGNNIVDCVMPGPGIFLVSSQHNEICENKISKCWAGIYTYLDSSNNVITENKVQDCAYGIYLDEGANENEVNFNKVDYVVCTDPPPGAPPPYGGGIWVYGSYNAICFNKVSGDGVDLLDGGLGNDWENNKYKTASWL